MRIESLRRIFAASLATLALQATTLAQAPGSLSASSTACRITYGDGPFSTTGYYIVASDNLGPRYSLVGISGVTDSFGTYTFARPSGTQALLWLSDSLLLRVTGSMNQSLPSTGTLVLQGPEATPGTQVSEYTFTNLAVPPTIAGRTMFCTVTAGAAPLDASGSFKVDLDSSTYTLTGTSGAVSDSTGTYTYAPYTFALGTANSVTCAGLGLAPLVDSVRGAARFYFGLTSSSTGWFAMSDGATGFEIGLLTMLSVPTSVSAADGLSTSTVNLTWLATPGASSYRVYRTVPPAAEALLASPTANTYADTTAPAGVVCTYRVTAVCSAGETTKSAANTGWRNIDPPATLAATDGTLTTGVQLTWPAVTGATGYRVYRAIGSATPAAIGTTAAPTVTYLDTTATPGTTYTYRVAALTAGGESRTNTSDTGWRNLAAPTNFAASDGTSTACVITTWTGVANAWSYRVYRATATGTLTAIGTSRSTSYADMTATPGVTYRYAVSALSLSGEGARSTVDTGYRAIASGGGPATGGGGVTGRGMVAPARGTAAVVSDDANLSPAGSDPALLLGCDPATWLHAIDLGSPDLDGRGEPDACQRRRGDLDLSGSIDLGDAAMLAASMYDEPVRFGDLDGDGRVDTADLAELLRRIASTR